MTLGEFRKITEHYGDECILYKTNNLYGSALDNATVADNVLIEICCGEDMDPEGKIPRIIVV